MRVWALRHVMVAVTMILGCGGPKEAADPSDMLGVDADDSHAPGGTTDAPRRRVASEQECEDAARRMVHLGFSSADDREAHRAEIEQLVADTTARCRAQEVTAREAKCIATANSERDIDVCIDG